MRAAAQGWAAWLGSLLVAVTFIDVVACAAGRTGVRLDGLTRAQADQFVRAHNAWRRRAFVSPLRWAEDLAARAQAHAVYLAAHGCVLEHGPLPLDVGQNLYKAGPLRSEGNANALLAVTAAMVVDAWGAESADYSPEHDTCAPNRQCGHYTQMVWATTDEVGCGMSVCPTLGQVWVCDYRPPGNIRVLK
jgi:pathogenesis-related protein 1